MYRKVGIIGGMGPEATAEMYRRIIRVFQRRYGAVYDSDYPEMVIVNLPIPDVVEREGYSSAVKDMLVETASKLKEYGVDFIAIPCNTVSVFSETIRKVVGIEVIDIVEEVAKEVKNEALTCVGLLATENTIRARLYQRALEGVRLIVPTREEQRRVTEIILSILSGRKRRRDREYLYKLSAKMKERGAEKVIVGCTDLSLIVGRGGFFIDSLNVLVESVVRHATFQVSSRR
jgi:aspartate racemase